MRRSIQQNRGFAADSTKGGSVSELDSMLNGNRNGAATRVELAGVTPLCETGVNGSAGHVFANLAEFRHCQTKAKFPLWKRIIDLTAILLMAPIWSPILLVLAVWIKLVSRGPVFYRQLRVGYEGIPFTILKFRSMRLGAETTSHENHFRRLVESNASMVKLDALNDRRLIPGGRQLRALGLDELPQLLNVLRGEMSLVGPRPCTVKEFDCYEDWQKERVNVPPGLTGYWQVNGKNRTTFTQMVEMDLRYVERMSLALDLAILFATVPAVVLQAVESTWRPPTP